MKKELKPRKKGADGGLFFKLTLYNWLGQIAHHCLIIGSNPKKAIKNKAFI